MQVSEIPANGSAEVTRKPVVLCLDDDPATLGSLRRLLRREPYDLVTTANPGEALARLDDSFVEVVISDELMPWFSGTSFLKIVEKRSPATARLLVSGNPHVAEVAKQQGDLVHHFISKPWVDEDLISLLRGLVKGPSPEPATARGRLARVRRDGTGFMVERPVLVECNGRTAEDVTSKLLGMLRRSGTEDRDVVAVLEGLDHLAGDPVALLADIVRGMGSSGVRMHLLDRTGIVRDFFQFAEMFNPRLKFYGPKFETDLPKSILLVDPVAPRRVFLKLLFNALGHSCRAVGSPAEARTAMDADFADLVMMELSEASEPEIAFVRDLARTGRGTEVVPLLAVERAWSPTIARKWNLVRPLVRPYRFLDLHDAVR